ncbi:hypothetical protein M5689_003330 [Euphorbia peplus]|nr:hypothetical protein M5689_003330 [Euphorbia peplus]
MAEKRLRSVRITNQREIDSHELETNLQPLDSDETQQPSQLAEDHTVVPETQAHSEDQSDNPLEENGAIVEDYEDIQVGGIILQLFFKIKIVDLH